MAEPIMNSVSTSAARSDGSVRGVEDGELTGFDTFRDSNAPGTQ